MESLFVCPLAKAVFATEITEKKRIFRTAPMYLRGQRSLWTLPKGIGTMCG